MADMRIVQVGTISYYGSLAWSVSVPGDLLPGGERHGGEGHRPSRRTARDTARVQDNKQSRDRGDHIHYLDELVS